jgi:2-polyprenyl-3-methyl-5-hydroxy-6-metoxy-1,4-benzoquinol methylase
VRHSKGSAGKRYFYDGFADRFDDYMNQYDLQTRMSIVFNELLPQDIAGSRLLDAGCGTGHFSRAAGQRGALVTAMDLGGNLLRRVGQKCRSDRIIGSITDAPFEDDSFDCIICSEVIEHTESPEMAIRELYRILKKGGTLALTVPNRIWKLSCIVANVLRIRAYEGFENWQGYFQLKGVLEQNGFVVERYRGFHIFPFQISLMHWLLRRADRMGYRIGAVYLNIAAGCKK